MLHIARVEGRTAGQKLIDRCAKGIHIISFLGCGPLHLLRAHVERGAAHKALHGGAAQGIGHRRRNPKIRQLQAAGAADHDIARLEVPMDDFFLMGIFKGVGQLQHPILDRHPIEDSIGLGGGNGGEIGAIHKFQ